MSFSDVASPGYVVSVVSDRELIFHQFEVQKDLTSEQLKETTEIKMFQDAGLNPMLEYKIAFSKRPNIQDPRMITVGGIAVSTGVLESATAPLVSSISYIDSLLPLSTLPFALYSSNILEPKRDVFVYFQRDALIISIFDEGEFIYGKSQNFGLKKLMETYIQLSGDRIEFENFMNLLTNPGEVTENAAAVLGNIREAISNALYSAKNILLYAGRVSGVTNPDRVFVGTSHGLVPGLEDMAQEVLEIEGHEFVFYTSFFTQKDVYIDQMALLALLEAQNIANGLRANPFNVTNMQRPGAFTARSSGKAILLIAASLIIAIGWPVYFLLESLYYDTLTKAEMVQLGQSKIEFDAVQESIRRLTAEQQTLTVEQQAAMDKLNTSKTLLADIHKKRVLLSPVALALSRLYEDLIAHGVKVVEIDIKGRDSVLSIRAFKDTHITGLLEVLAEKRYSPSLDKIIKQESGEFTAELKVSLP
ncbi:MAG: hypothetical protein LBN32_02995 [Helicobacteraceae bacterium]|nr:hypothetical protein [Helicobacteraceae bacterium]